MWGGGAWPSKFKCMYISLVAKLRTLELSGGDMWKYINGVQNIFEGAASDFHNTLSDK